MRRRRTLYVAVGAALALVVAAAPVNGHVGGTVAHLWKHLRPLTDSRYYQKIQVETFFLRKTTANNTYVRATTAESRYVNVGEDVLRTFRYSGFGTVLGCTEFSLSCKASASASCLIGHVVGGGFSASSDALYAVTSEPTSNGWRVEMGNLSTSSSTFSVYVICART